MANTKSAKKAVRSQARKALYNLRRKRNFKEAQLEVKKAVSENDSKTAAELLSKAYKQIDKAAKGKTISKNAAARYKSRLAALVQTIATKPAKKAATKKAK